MEGFGVEINFSSENEPLMTAVCLSDQSQDLFFRTATHFANQPILNNAGLIIRAASETEVPYYDVLNAILTSESLEPNERSKLAASYIINTHSERTEHLKSIAPEALCTVLGSSEEDDVLTIDELSADIHTMFRPDLEINNVCENFTELYCQLLDSDCDNFTNAILERPEAIELEVKNMQKARELEARNKKLELMFSAGKTLASAAIGGLIAGAILKRSSK